MNNFTYSIPTTIHFGKGQISHLSELAESGSRVLLVYGGGSIKRSGLYDRALAILGGAGLSVFELGGVEPNPRIESVRRGVELCRREQIDMILAIGGGSAIDCAKVIAAGAKYDGDAWDLVLDPGKILSALPVYAVSTISATGSEMDGIAVISDLTKNEKWATAAQILRPVMSILDPEYTFTVSPRQTSAGTADIISHIFENYFTNVPGAAVQAHFCEALLKTAFTYGPAALKDPADYEARANLMWTSYFAINGLLQDGAEVTWCVHPIEHELSAFYDIVHGEGLAILTPRWMRHVLSEKTASKFADYGRNVWNISGEDDMAVALRAIAETEKFFFQTMRLPSTLRDVGISDDTHFEIMAEKAAAGCAGAFVPLSKEDILSIFRMSL